MPETNQPLITRNKRRITKYITLYLINKYLMNICILNIVILLSLARTIGTNVTIAKSMERPIGVDFGIHFL